MSLHLKDLLGYFGLEEAVEEYLICPKCKERVRFYDTMFSYLVFCERKQGECPECRTKIKRGYLLRNYAKDEKIREHYSRIYPKKKIIAPSYNSITPDIIGNVGATPIGAIKKR